MKKIYSPEDVAAISSTYLAEGRKQESWEITRIEIDDDELLANVKMSSICESPTDDQGFHLTIFSTLEFLSQLKVIYVHLWDGLTEKTREGWMVDSQVSCKEAIRDPENIKVEMRFEKIRKVGEKVYSIAHCVVSDPQGGCFEARLKTLLS